MKMRLSSLISSSLIAGLISSVTVASATELEFGGATPLEWSTRLAKSEMTRYGDSLYFEKAPKARWDYTSGLLSGFLLDLAETTGDDTLRDYAEGIVGSFVAPDGSIRTYKMSDFNIDMVTPGKVTLRLYERTGDERYKIASDTVREQLRQHPRTTEGGFWHKQRYPHQMWLDGLYMASPFYAAYGKMFNEPEAFDDVAKQLILMDRHSYIPEVGLHRHGWDEARAQSWADPKTGLSPNFWGRSEGWYAMALVDSLDSIPGIHHDVESIVEILRRVAAGIEKWQDPETGVWWQVLDQPGRVGNYLEATASSQFLYALAKAVNKGYLPRDRYEPVIRRGYAGLIKQFVRVNAEGLTDLTQCCSGLVTPTVPDSRGMAHSTITSANRSLTTIRKAPVHSSAPEFKCSNCSRLRSTLHRFGSVAGRTTIACSLGSKPLRFPIAIFSSRILGPKQARRSKRPKRSPTRLPRRMRPAVGEWWCLRGNG